MKRALGSIGALLLGTLVAGCTGPQGAMGKPGVDGLPGGTSTPSVSAVTPAYAYLGRTVDLIVAGSGTAWSATTTVAFADPKVTVNKVTAASATGLLVNVSIGADAAVAATDVTVTDGSAAEVYAGAFALRAPLQVTLDQKGGVPQGGFAGAHVAMLDLDTPYDPDHFAPTFSAADVGLSSTPAVSDYAADFLVGADVLAQAAESVDLTIESGPAGAAVGSTAKAAFPVAARMPAALTAAAPGSGMIAIPSDSALFQFTPAAASTRFVQLGVSSAGGGGVHGIVVPKSGKLADTLGGFGVRFGLGLDSADPLYLVVTDGGVAAAPPPYAFAASVVETPCTAFAEQLADHDSAALAQAVSALPALVQGDLLDGAATPDDWYQITVSGAAASTPRTLHVASGGDGLSDVDLTVFATDGMTSLGTSVADDIHKDLVVGSVVTSGAYFVKVSAGAGFDAKHAQYDLFIEVK